jgi:hypothetical protein
VTESAAGGQGIRRVGRFHPRAYAAGFARALTQGLDQ